MDYAVIKTGGKQYKVSKGTVLDVDRLSDEKKSLILEDVLLLVKDGQAKIGKPTLKDVRVKAEIVENLKGDKIRVSKFKSKVRYRRVSGFRASLSRLKINDIVSGLKTSEDLPKPQDLNKKKSSEKVAKSA